MQQASARQPVPEQSYRIPTGPSLIMSQNSMRVPKFDGSSQLHLWSSKLQAYLTARGVIDALETTSDPIRIAGVLGGMTERDRSVHRHGQEKVEKCEKAWEFRMESMQGQPVEERMHAAGLVEGAWKAVMDWYQPKEDAERDHLQKSFENIAMQGDEYPKLLRSCRGKAERIIRIGYPQVGPRGSSHTCTSSSVRIFTT